MHQDNKKGPYDLSWNIMWSCSTLISSFLFSYTSIFLCCDSQSQLHLFKFYWHEFKSGSYSNFILLFALHCHVTTQTALLNSIMPTNIIKKQSVILVAFISYCSIFINILNSVFFFFQFSTFFQFSNLSFSNFVTCVWFLLAFVFSKYFYLAFIY